MGIEVLVAVIAAVPASVAAAAAWRAARNSRPVSNGWTGHVTETLEKHGEALGRIEGLLEAHVRDRRAHLTVV